MTISPRSVSMRTYGLAFAIVLFPAWLQVAPSCATGDGTLSALELEVSGENQIAFDPGQTSYAVELPHDPGSVVLRAYSTDPTATVRYELSSASMVTKGAWRNGGGEVSLEGLLPPGDSTLTLTVTSPETYAGQGAIWGTYTVDVQVALGVSPGTLLSAEEIDPQEIDPFGYGIRGWRVLYASEATDGTPIEVSGVVVASNEPPEGGPRDVVSYGHGSTGLYDACAPSRSVQDYPWIYRTMVPELINAGYVYVATDYEGLGTSGIHPYIVGESEGRGVLDIVRAAQQIREAHAGNRVVIWGISQGGHGALFAGEIARDWAPDIEVLGIVSAAPGSEFDVFSEAVVQMPDARGFMWLLTVAYEATYPGLNLEDIYDAETLGTIAGLVDQEACSGPFIDAARDVENAGVVTNPVDLPAWRERLVENSPGYEMSEMPILLLQGTEDPVTPQWLTDMLFNRLCNIDSQTDYRVFEGYNHAQSLTLNLPIALEWTTARFAGDAALDTCPE